MRSLSVLAIVAALMLGMACTSAPAATPVEVVTLPPSVTHATPAMPTPFEKAAYDWLDANGWMLVPPMFADPRVQEIVDEAPHRGQYPEWHDNISAVREVPPYVYATVSKYIYAQPPEDAPWPWGEISADVLVIFEGGEVVDYQLRGIRLRGPDGFIWPPTLEVERDEAARLWAEDNWQQVVVEWVLAQAPQEISGRLSGKVPQYMRDQLTQESLAALAVAFEAYDPGLISTEVWLPYAATLTITKIVELPLWGPPESIVEAKINLAFDSMDSPAVTSYKFYDVTIWPHWTDEHPPPSMPTPA